MKKILIISDSNINEYSSVLTLRLYDFAKYLSKDNIIYLFIPNDNNKISFHSENLILIENDIDKLNTIYKECDALIVNGLVLEKYDFLNDNKKPIIYDGYDPFVFEEIDEDPSISNVDIIKKIAVKSDYVLCASQMQKNYWIGMLSVYNRVNPVMYREDNKLMNLIDVVGVKYSIQDTLDNSLNDYVLCELDEDSDIDLIIESFSDLKDVNLKIICDINTNSDDIYDYALEKVNSLGYKNISIIKCNNIDRQRYIADAKIILNIDKDNLKARFKPKDKLKDYLENKKLIISTYFNYIPDELKEKKVIVLLDKINPKDLCDKICTLMKDESLCNEYIFNLEEFLKNQPEYLLKLKDIVDNLKVSLDKSYVTTTTKATKKDFKSNLVFFKSMVQKGIKTIINS